MYVGWLFAAVVGWLIEHFRKSSEIQKLRAEKSKLEQETVKLAGETLQNIQKHRTQYRDACVACNDTGAALRALLLETPPDKPRIDAARELLCKALLEQAIPSFLSYMEWEHLRRKLQPDKLRELLTDDVVRELRRFNDWLTTINIPHLIEWLGRNPARVDKFTLRPFVELAEDLPSSERTTVEDLLRRETDQLITIGQ